jgi:hypothetical protein
MSIMSQEASKVRDVLCTMKEYAGRSRKTSKHLRLTVMKFLKSDRRSWQKGAAQLDKLGNVGGEKKANLANCFPHQPLELLSARLQYSNRGDESYNWLGYGA